MQTPEALFEPDAARDAERRLFQHMPGFVAVLSGPNHVFEYVNDSYVRLAGPREKTGQSVRTVLPEVVGQGFFELLDQVYVTGEPFVARTLPIKLVGEDAERFVDFVYQPLCDDAGKVTGIFVSGHDTTEGIRAERRLRAPNADLGRQVIERAQARGRTWLVSPDLMGALNAQGYFETSNPAWQSVLGWSEDEVAATSIWELLHPDDVERTRGGFALTQIGQPAIRFPNRYRCKDGSYRWISWVGVPEDGLVYCTGRDITQEKAREAELASAQDALRQSQKMEAVGQLTGGVVHDFNNLLTVIKSSNDLLKRPDLPEGRRDRYIGAISDTVDRAAKLTGQLLAFARRQAFRPTVFDAAESVRMIGDMLGTLTGSRVRIVTRLTDAPCFVNADPGQFDTALVNLAMNARDAMAGKGQLTNGVQPVEVVTAARAHLAVSTPSVAVIVTDTGSGILAENLTRIFEPFFTTMEVGQGTGLGLSRVFGFAKQSGGEITVESEVGRGTTFTLYLPRAAPSDAIAPSGAEGTTQDGRGLCVLVVEDNASVGEFVTQTLEELGYRANWVRDAKAAPSELADSPGAHEIVFSDVVMPGMNGIELAVEIKRLHPALPVVLTGGYSHVLAREGGHGFELLQKPYSVEALSHVLRRAAARRRRRVARR